MPEEFMKDTQLALKPDEQLAFTDPISAGLRKIMDGGVTSENVEVLGKLLDVYERMETKRSEQAFVAAFVKLQSEMPKVETTRVVKNNDGTPRYAFAPFEEIMDKVRPLLKEHCFTITFDTRTEEGRIKSICTLMHVAGHSRSNEFSVRNLTGPPGSSDAQKDGSAKSYAKRGALCDCLNIVTTGMDDDARQEGAFITKEDAEWFRQRVRDTKADGAKFLKLAKAETFETIRGDMFETLDDVLTKREVAKA